MVLLGTYVCSTAAGKSEYCVTGCEMHVNGREDHQGSKKRYMPSEYIDSFHLSSSNSYLVVGQAGVLQHLFCLAFSRATLNDCREFSYRIYIKDSRGVIKSSF